MDGMPPTCFLVLANFGMFFTIHKGYVNMGLNLDWDADHYESGK
jgi:hypothetical protein